MKIAPKHKPLKYVLAAAAIMIVGLAVFLAWPYTKSNDAGDGINYSPATKEDEEFNNQVKDELPQNESPTGDTNSDTEPPGDKNTVTPVISAHGQPNGPGTDLRVNGYVPGIIESDGTCTLTLTKGSETATVSKTSLQNAKDTSCGQLIIPYAQLSAGSWQAVLSYTSSSSEGLSTKTEIEVR